MALAEAACSTDQTCSGENNNQVVGLPDILLIGDIQRTHLLIFANPLSAPTTTAACPVRSKGSLVIVLSWFHISASFLRAPRN
jgi:hypothetical protein